MKALESGQRCWKIATGTNGVIWPECVREGFIGVSWDEIGDVSELDEAQFRDRVEIVGREQEWSLKGPLQVWEFANDIRPGDTIVANMGTGLVLGLGTVTGKYRFARGQRYSHRLPVDWHDTRPRAVSLPHWLQTLMAVSPEELGVISEAPTPPLAAPYDGLFGSWERAQLAADLLRQCLDQMGCQGLQDQRFSLSLRRQTGGAGLRLNAGTWMVAEFRSKQSSVGLALFVNEDCELPGIEMLEPYHQLPDCRFCYLPQEQCLPTSPALASILRESMNKLAERLQNWTVCPYRAAHRQSIFEALFDPAKLTRLLLLGTSLSSPSGIPAEITADHVRKALSEIGQSDIPPARQARNWVVNWEQREYPVKYLVSVASKIALGDEIEGFNSQQARGFLKKLGFEVQKRGSAAAPVTQELSLAKIRDEVKGAGLVLSDRALRRYHISLTTRGFVILAGVSGTGKTWLTEVYAKAVGAEYEAIPVAPNWTTNEDLLGYHNPVDGQYYDTAFSRFLRRAAESWRDALQEGLTPTPFHILLDEMNLARVEYYFAKFLSALEVRSRQGHATLELGPNNFVDLPPNLYFIGTVNVDETTHGFADKVFDRAQLMELRVNRAALSKHMTGQVFQEDLMAMWDAVAQVAPFAFRVIDDIRCYIDASAELGVEWTEALDEQYLQKILPKLKGADSRVETALDKVLEHCQGRFPLTETKAKEMLDGYRQHGFASYF